MGTADLKDLAFGLEKTFDSSPVMRPSAQNNLAEAMQASLNVKEPMDHRKEDNESSSSGSVEGFASY